MIVVFERHEAERLEHALRRLLYRRQDLGHAVDWARLRLKRNFDEITLRQRLRQLQQSAGHRNDLEFSFSAPAIF